MRAKLSNGNHCAVLFLRRAVANLCWYYYTCSSKEGLSEEEGECEEGYYCEEGSKTAKGKICPPGSYCPAGKASPLACPPG